LGSEIPANFFCLKIPKKHCKDILVVFSGRKHPEWVSLDANGPNLAVETAILDGNLSKTTP